VPPWTPPWKSFKSVFKGVGRQGSLDGFLRAIRTRIKSVRNTQKITKAMKLVAAAKLRRAQDAVLRTRPYAQALSELLGSLARARAAAEVPPHPLMEVRENRAGSRWCC